jgi:hypothetical protein
MRVRPSLARLFFAFPPVAAFLLVSLTARPARAADPVDIEVAAIAGYGTAPTNSRPISPLGVGLGGRAGVGFRGLYAGVSVVDYLGSTSSSDGTILKARSLLYGVELGYGVDLAGITIRPQLGMGAMRVTSSSEFPGPGDVVYFGFMGNGSTTYIYLQPSVLAEARLGRLLVGVDAGLFCIPVGPSNGTSDNELDVAFTAHAEVGVVF